MRLQKIEKWAHCLLTSCIFFTNEVGPRSLQIKDTQLKTEWREIMIRDIGTQ